MPHSLERKRWRARWSPLSFGYAERHDDARGPRGELVALSTQGRSCQPRLTPTDDPALGQEYGRQPAVAVLDRRLSLVRQCHSCHSVRQVGPWRRSSAPLPRQFGGLQVLTDP